VKLTKADILKLSKSRLCHAGPKALTGMVIREAFAYRPDQECVRKLPPTQLNFFVRVVTSVEVNRRNGQNGGHKMWRRPRVFRIFINCTNIFLPIP